MTMVVVVVLRTTSLPPSFDVPLCVSPCVVWSTFLFLSHFILPLMSSSDRPAMESHIKKASASLYDLNFSEDDDLAGDSPVTADEKRRRPSPVSKRGSAAAPPSCQADICFAVLADAKNYHRRHKVCEFHAKAPAVVVAGLRQRFCQQCSRFHEVSEFDEAKRSCRSRLAGHNQRRRRKGSSSEAGGEASGGGDEMNETQCRAATDGRANSAAYKHFQIR